MHFDTYLSVGGGTFATKKNVNPSFNVALGEHIFLVDWLALGFEVRNYVFVEPRDEIADVQNLMMFGLSLGFFFPTSSSQE